MKKISIILPVYNAEKYLERCIESLLNQTYREFEVIAVDDGSTDDSVRILKNYSNLDSRIIVLQMEHGNVSTARNSAISQMTGEYATFIDADDWCEIDYLMKLKETLESKGADLAVCGCNEISGNKGLERYLEDFEPALLNEEGSSDKLMAFLAEYNILSACWSKLYKTKIISGNKIEFSEKAIVNSDIVFNMEYLLYCNHVSYIRLPLYNYVKYSSSLSSRRDPNSVDTVGKVVNEKMRVLVKSRLPEGVIESAIKQWEFRALAFSCYREVTSTEKIPLGERIEKTLVLADMVKNMLESGKVNTDKIKKRTMTFVRSIYFFNRITLPVILLPIHLYSVFKEARLNK